MVKILRGNDGHLLTSEQQDSEIPIAAIAQRKLRFSMIFIPDFRIFRLPVEARNRAADAKQLAMPPRADSDHF